MPRLRLRVAPKFLLVVAVLLPALIGLTSIGIHGLAVLKDKVNVLYSDHLRVTDQTDQLARDLGRAAEVALHEIVTVNATTADTLRTELSQSIEPQVGADLARVVSLHTSEETQRTEVRALQAGWAQFLALQHSGQFAYFGTNMRRYETLANTVSGLFESMDRAAGALIASGLASAAQARSDAIRTQQQSEELMLWAALGCVLLVVGAAFLLVRDVVPRVREAMRASAAVQAEFAAAMQLAESEEEAQELLSRHLQRAVAGSTVVVLSRNNSDDRLDAATDLDHDSELTERLLDAKPQSCLAVRLATSQEQGGELDPLLQCEVCGNRAEPSTCEPLIVGGQVIGSVLLSRAERVDEGDKQRIRESVAQASPVLANLRNLALAERRAATDSLTGLPNKRAAQETLMRMVAHASRTVSPLAAGLLDLDHFKQINDLHGHAKGDEVLAMVGAALRSTLRESDFVARYGGEEFLILLPDSGAEAAGIVAEKVRCAISEIVVADIDRPVTASLGLAVFPHDAGDLTTLIRHADRALYAAKRQGRNRVENFTRTAGAMVRTAPFAD